jgi:hypothetical protein
VRRDSRIRREFRLKESRKVERKETKWKNDTPIIEQNINPSNKDQGDIILFTDFYFIS